MPWSLSNSASNLDVAQTKRFPTPHHDLLPEHPPRKSMGIGESDFELNGKIDITNLL
jgi:hypothetical protein